MEKKIRLFIRWQKIYVSTMITGTVCARLPRQEPALYSIDNNHTEQAKDIFARAKKNPDKLSDRTASRLFKSHSIGLDLDWYTDIVGGKGLELLNNFDFDSYAFTLTTADIGFNLEQYNIAKEKKYEIKAALRAKNIVGNTGNFSLLKRQPFKIGLGRSEQELMFEPKYLSIWPRELWLRYFVDPHHKSNIRFGYFPYQVGCGVSLGNGHRLGHIVSGFTRDRDVDQYRLGLEVAGEFDPDRIGYNAYVGVIDRKSSNFYETAAFTRWQEPNYRVRPHRGDFVNNIVAACQLVLKPHNEHTDVTLRPYFIVNKDDEQFVEYPGDASMFMGIAGFELSMTKGKLNFTLESAFNLGTQYVEELDRDIVYSTGLPYHLYLFQDHGDPGRPRWRVASRTTHPENLSYTKKNGEIFRDVLDSSIRYKNAYNRFRRAYKNSFNGFFLCGDVSYEYCHSPEATSTLGFTAGFVLGDENPNDSTERLLANRLNGHCTDSCPQCFQDCLSDGVYKDFNKSYRGFVGIEQLYSGRAVKSVFLMDVRKLNQPLFVPQGETRITYPEITNIAFLGAGFNYKQRALDRVFDISCNLLGYFTPYQEYKGFNYGLDTLFKLNSCGEQETLRLLPSLEDDAEIKLGRFLGAELNTEIRYQFDPNLQLFARGAVLIPGTYYTDAKGKYIPLSEQFRLAATDYSGYELDSQKYTTTLGSAFAVLASLGFEYHFDS